MLAPIPDRLTDATGTLRTGRWAGTVPADPVGAGPRHGRVRRWRYTAAGDDRIVVGAAVVDLGPLAVAFAFATVDGRTSTWETRRPLRWQATVGGTARQGASLTRRGGGGVRIGGDSSLTLDVPTADGPLHAEIEVVAAVTPMTLVTATAGGGWNATEKAAGHAVRGEVQVGDGRGLHLSPDAAGWADWASGRQDRRTVWRWAAGGGVAEDGRRVGLNASTGMNGMGPGEDIVWWDGEPYPLEVTELAPAGEDAGGAWRVAGHDWELRFTPRGVRAEHARMLVVTSDYTQPIGRFDGTLPGPDGRPVAVSLSGVTEDHLAVW